ncbi:hypothetical protein NBO_386g0009 [Nosema bombycis CQ1]|uniref:Uncharacterized protein n=1 Tax=Nosema bombycis (strain CQ1 / CVCC 102059) TaxID=578461 RepID=R0KR11_NOSB1|nr:hypothetical protein NBO_386g0009 [Nosema bombycis CQ1]|eukprot:EOB12652.1 hypothetical protein NBO_386g0009 [Nosema bombycis CQ1]
MYLNKKKNVEVRGEGCSKSEFMQRGRSSSIYAKHIYAWQIGDRNMYYLALLMN